MRTMVQFSGFLNPYRYPLEYHLWLREKLKYDQGQKTLSYPRIGR